MMPVRFLGIDGGGSSTRAFILGPHGAILEERHAGPSNVIVVGEERADETLSSLLGTEEQFDAVVAGIAGADRPWVRDFWQTRLSRHAQAVWVTGDYHIAWAALTDGEPGLVAIFGTGSVFYAESSTHQIRLGGYGWKVGDVGSGIMLGQAAVNRVLGALEGWSAETALKDPVLAWADAHDKLTLLNHIYHPEVDWRSVSDLAAAVFRAADLGDSAAAQIIETQATLIERYFFALQQTADLPEGAPAGLAGGLAPFWLPHLEQRNMGSLCVVSREPGIGAARLAARYFYKRQEGVSH